MTFKLLRVTCWSCVLSGSVWLVWRRAQDDANLFCCVLPNSHSQRRFGFRFSDSGLQGFALASSDGALICSSLEDFIKITSNSRWKVAPSTVRICWDCHGFCTSLVQRGPSKVEAFVGLHAVLEGEGGVKSTSRLKSVFKDKQMENNTKSFRSWRVLFCFFILKSFRMLHTEKIRFYGCV